MKPSSIALTIAALLTTISTAHAWLGDSEDALSHRYGKPTVVQISTATSPPKRATTRNSKRTLAPTSA